MALVLARRINETVVIGPNVTIKVVELRGDRVTLAIDAPKDVTIARLEVAQRKEKETA